MDRVTFLEILSALATVSAAGGNPPSLSASVAGVSVPQSALATDALALAYNALPVEVFRHSLRTFLFAELFARKKGLDHDPELVYVAAILHDVGLSPQHMSERYRFQVDGANAARALLKKYGIEGPKADTVWDAIALHDQGDIARFKQPEVMLVSIGVAGDFGALLPVLDRKDVAAVLEAAPRAKFVEVFLDSTAAFAKRKPQATGNSWVTDVAYRLVPGFHLANFVDEVKQDPFAGY